MRELWKRSFLHPSRFYARIIQMYIFIINPNEFNKEFVQYLDYCRRLRFDEEPDYNYCRNLFKDCFKRMGYETDNVYDWDIIAKAKKIELNTIN